MNSTTRSLLFWMVLVVVVVLFWNLSSQFRTGDNAVDFSDQRCGFSVQFCPVSGGVNRVRRLHRQLAYSL